MSVNSRLRILQYKWLMRTYVTPVKLNRYNHNLPDICIKCGLKGTLFHCMWECDKIQTFWVETKNTIENIISKQIILDPKLFIMSLYPSKHTYSKAEMSFIDTSLLIAKRCIALNWKNTNAPSITQWLKQMLSSLPLERITYVLKLKQHMFEKIWGPFVAFIKNVDCSQDLTDF